MKQSTHITPNEVAALQAAGETVVLVCAYDDEANHQRIGIKDSLSFPTFQKQVSAMPKDRQIVFYCDCPRDELAQEKTAAFRKQGYVNAQVLDGGINAWHNMAA